MIINVKHTDESDVITAMFTTHNGNEYKMPLMDIAQYLSLLEEFAYKTLSQPPFSIKEEDIEEYGALNMLCALERYVLYSIKILAGQTEQADSVDKSGGTE